MKTKILILTVSLFGGIALGQEEIDCLKEQTLEKQIECLKEQLIREKKKNEFFKLEDSDYYKGNYSEVLIDFSKESPIISLPENIKKGDFYQIVVQNFNPNRYSVQINSADSTNSRALKLPTFADFSLDALASLTESFNKTTSISLPSQIPMNLGQEIDTLNLWVAEYKANPAQFAISAHNNEDIIKGIIKSEQQNLTNAETVLREHSQSFDNLKFGIYKYRLNRYSKLPQSDRQFQFKKSLQKFSEIRKNSDDFKKEVNRYQSNFLKLLTPNIEQWLEQNAGYNEKITKLKTTYSTLLKKVGEFKELISADNGEKLLKSIVFLHAGDNEYRSLPIQFKDDIEELDISFVPKDSTSGLQTETLPTLFFPVRNNVYWSVGTSFYYSNLNNERFSVHSRPNTDSTAVYTIQREEDIKREAGMAIMLRFGRKIDQSEKFGVHGSFGPGVSIEKNVRPRILFGIGASYGKKHNIVVDWGGILGYVDRKSVIIEENAEFLERPEATVTKIMIGNYFSIGYMFRL